MKRGVKKTLGKCDDVWCDFCDENVGDTYEIDSAKRLVCGRCLLEEVPKVRSSSRVHVTHVPLAVAVEV